MRSAAFAEEVAHEIVPIVPKIKNVETNSTHDNLWHADNGIENTFEEAATSEVTPRFLACAGIDRLPHNGVCECPIGCLDLGLELVNCYLCGLQQFLGLSQFSFAFLVNYFTGFTRIIWIILFDRFVHRYSVIVSCVGLVDLGFDLPFFSLKSPEFLGVRIVGLFKGLSAFLKSSGSLCGSFENLVYLAVFWSLVGGSNVLPAVLCIVDNGLVEHADRCESRAQLGDGGRVIQLGEISL
ncbi:hypothetical protein D8M36_10025 [Dermabacter sp. HSID17554]|nr:hypothetical protein D8M36_10025 [Dermabacter sp. HSID17554]